MSASAIHGELAATAAVSGRRSFSKPATLRATLVCGFVLALAWAAWVASPAPYLESDAELARLLRGMAVIKGAIALGALSLLLWRFARPVSAPITGVYLVGAWALAGSTVLIFQLTLIPWAAAAFHVGVLSLLVAAWRDDRKPRRVSAA